MPDAQPWEGKEFPHTLSVLELDRDGYRYWGWYGLNEGGGIGLARSSDLVNWTKYEKNPLWTVDRKHPKLLYFAITRGYDTPSGYNVPNLTRFNAQSIGVVISAHVTDAAAEQLRRLHEPADTASRHAIRAAI